MKLLTVSTNKKKRSIEKLRRLMQERKAKSTTPAPNPTSTPRSTPPPTTTATPGLPLNAREIAKVLSSEGYHQYLLGRHNGDRAEDNASRTVKVVAKFIDWTHRTVKGRSIAKAEHVLRWLTCIIRKHYTVITEYFTHLRVVRLLKPATIRLQAMQVLKVCAWYVVYRLRAHLSALDGVKTVCSDLRRAAAYQERLQRATQTMERAVSHRRMPPGGLGQLLEAVIARMPWARNLQGHHVDKETYDAFMQMMYAAMYTSSAQGRQSGLMDLKYHQRTALMEKGFANTTKFKTAAKYRLQPVTLSGATKELLGVYLDHLRPQVARMPPLPADPLWLKFSGAREEALGRQVTKFFKAELGLIITTTAIRSLVETAMHEKHQDGEITQAQRESVQAINGHSSQVTQDYYVREDRAREVTLARNAFNAITLQDSPAEGEAPLFPKATERDVHQALVWGLDHPDGPERKKARWTDAEVRYIGNWCEQQLRINPHHGTLAAACLKHIMADPAAQRIFHEIHVLDSARLRHGYRMYQRLVEAGLWNKK